MAESVSDGTGPPRDNLTWCRAVIYTHVVILALSLFASWLDRRLIALPIETRDALIEVLALPILYGLYVSPIMTIVVLSQLKHASFEFRFGLFALEVVLWFVQIVLAGPLFQ